MKNRRLSRFLLVLLLLVLCLPLSGQETVVFEQPFVFSPHERDASARITNRFLQAIAESKGSIRAFASYTYSGTLHVGIRKDDQGEMTLVIQLASLKVSGDHTYRDFELERVLTPDRIGFLIEIRNAEGKTVHRESFADLPLPLVGSEIMRHRLKLTGIETPHILIEDVRLSYSEHVPERYDAWLMALEGYYEVSEMIEQADRLSGGLTHANPETLILEEFKLCEAEHLLGLINEASFHRWMDLESLDPEQVSERTDRLTMRLDTLRRGFNRSISQIDQMFYELGNELLAEEKQRDALDHYHSALVYNPFHIPSHLAIAGLQLDSLHKHMALERLGKVLAYMFPDAYLKTIAGSLADSLYVLYFEEALCLMDEGRYLDALKSLGQLTAFCEKVQGRYPCPDELHDMISAGHSGMFQSFMRVAEQAFHNSRLALALTYLKGAMAYYDTNSDYIADRKFAMLLMQRIANRYQRQGDQAYREGVYESAAAAFETLIDLCDTYPFLICVPDLRDRHKRATEKVIGP